MAAYFESWYTAAEWYGAGLATARSWVRILPLAAVYQRQLSVPSLRGSVNEYQRKLGSKQAYHTIHRPRIRGLLLFLSVVYVVVFGSCFRLCPL